VPLRAGDVVGTSASVKCPGCGKQIRNSTAVALIAQASGFFGGGYVVFAAFRAMEAAWGAPVALWAWGVLFVVGLLACVAITRVVGGLCYALYSLLRR
jgi:hypothetical protein